MSYSLQVLADHRNELLLAEAIGWLHDYRKCSEENLRVHAANLSKEQALPRNELATRYPDLPTIQLQLPVQASARSLTDLFNDSTWSCDVLGQFLSRCHNTSHFDKQEPIGGKQNHPGIKNSTAFGAERNVAGGLTSQLWDLPWNQLVGYSSLNRDNLRKSADKLFSQTIADTRRPINEVDLWSWGLLVGSLYKAALAGALLTGQTPAARDLHWRLLNIQVDGLDYLLNVTRIPDLLARQEVLSNGLERVRELLETTFPLGSEVYRDENGSVYVVPDIPDLLAWVDRNGIDLRTLVMQEFAKGTTKNSPALQLGGELLPHLELEVEPWWGQDPDWHMKTDASDNSPLSGQPLANELPGIARFLSGDVISFADPNQVALDWSNGNTADICTICGLRPQGAHRKSIERNVCDICEQRRGDRSALWATSQSDRTIWTDEVADTNGCMALIVGQFDLKRWFDGSLPESLLLIAPNDPENSNGVPVASKTPSFSRLRRIWETTRRFWQEVLDEALNILMDDRRRLKIHLDSNPHLGAYHVYELRHDEAELSLVWNPPQDGHDGLFLSADNLGYIARRLGTEPEIFNSSAASAIYVEDHLNERFVTKSEQPVLRNPDARTSQNRTNFLEGHSITHIKYQDAAYSPAIPILAEPRTFMALVPANKALDVVTAIKAKYEIEMGKVRNRLPLHLGVVYAGRRTPLASVLDAGRRMLRHPDQTVKAEVVGISPADPWPDQVSLTLKVGEREIAVNVPTIMGDGSTHDVWYPYWQVTGKPRDRDRWFVGPDDEHWVHVCNLQAGDTVAYTPSTFDFEYLDSSARRFEVAYNGNGQRQGADKQQRPYLLEQVDDLDKTWRQISHKLATSQIKSLEALIEAKRRDWEEPTGTIEGVSETFRQFVSDALHQTNAHTPALETAVLTGMLTDALEIYMTIHKEKTLKDQLPQEKS
ncbi:MAG: CRISPR-associated protein Csx11 [Chloroflexi bacterium]|nr:CRISPR-associated protein Csx11 [Chloroflexota bacterium]